MIALAAGRFDWSVTWTCVDFLRNEHDNGDEYSIVAGIDIDRGRQSEFDTTDTSTAIVYLNDQTRLFSPDGNNEAGAFYAPGLIGKQIALQAWDPATSAWVRQFRGWIDEITFDFNPATNFGEGVSINSNVQVHCVDLFDSLGRMEMDTTEEAGNRIFGNTPPSGSEQTIFYEDTDSGGEGMQTRLTQVADDCGISTDWYAFFTGNVELLEGLYDPGDSPLTVMRDAVDAELPGLANLFTDKQGRLHGHGRKAFFQPGTVWTSLAATDEDRDAVWKYREWACGDGASILNDPTLAQIREPLNWAIDQERIFNVGYAWPADIEEVDKPDQVFVGDTGSIDDYGRRMWRAEKLLTKEGSTTGLTGAQETKKFGELYATNNAAPHVRVEQLSFKSMALESAQATNTWALLLGADIGDTVTLLFVYPGGEIADAFAAEFSVQGSSMSIRPLNADMDLVEATFNVTNRSVYSDDVGLLG